jgi:prefoldin subunit 4
MKQKLEEEIEDLSAQSDRLQVEMSQLKAELYAKFGDNINLETDKDD